MKVTVTRFKLMHFTSFVFQYKLSRHTTIISNTSKHHVLHRSASVRVQHTYIHDRNSSNQDHKFPWNHIKRFYLNRHQIMCLCVCVCVCCSIIDQSKLHGNLIPTCIAALNHVVKRSRCRDR